MWINKRTEHVDTTNITIDWPGTNLPDVVVEIVCDQSGLLQIVSDKQGNVLSYYATLMAWTTGDRGHR